MANYASVDIFGNPAAPGWEAKNIAPVSIDGQTWRVNRRAAPAFEGLLKDMAAAGYVPKSSGGFNYRTIRGGSGLSQHAFGTAIDIDAANNPLGSTRTNMPANIAQLAAAHGIEWGGTWKNRPDPMHFEWKGGGGAPVTNVAAGAAQQPQDLAGMFAPAPMTTTAQAMTAPMAIGQAAPVQTEALDASALASLFAAPQQNAQAVQVAQQQKQAADQARRAALFSGDLFGPFA